MPSNELTEAIARHQEGDLTGARTIYEGLLAAEAGQADVLNLLGVLNAQEGDVETAEQLLAEALEADPDHARAHGSLGNLRRLQGRFDDALTSYERAADLDPENPVAQFNLGSACEALDRADDAEAAYRRAMSLASDYADPRFNLGVVLSQAGRVQEAIDVVLEGLSIEPENAAMHEKLGDLQRHAGRLDLAADAFEQALTCDPERGYLEHLVHAYRGDEVDTASSDYVRFLFDNFAEDYDDRLTGVLGYRVPQVLRELLDTHVGTDVRFERGLDLGCGTGLSGKAFHDIVETLDGVDLSSNMLERARKLDLYSSLTEAGIEEYLAESGDTFDLFVAADVFVYVGDLADTFRLMRERADEGAVVLFTTERGDADDFTLQKTGRYRHSADYLEGLAGASGFRMLHRSDADLRSENGEPVGGFRCLMVAV